MHDSTARLRGRRTGVLISTLAVAATGLALAGAPPAQAAEIPLTPAQVDTSATRATGHNDFGADGVRVWTEGSTSTDKAAGYFLVDQPLASVGEPAMAWTNNLPSQNYRPGLQLVTDFNGDGDVDGILVGEPVYADGSEFLGERWWLAGGSDRKPQVESPGVALPLDTSQPTYRQNIATLDEWRATYPDAQVIEGGWSLGSGALGDGVIHAITIGENDYVFGPGEPGSSVEVFASEVDTSETRATGHNDFLVPTGVRVWTEGDSPTDKAAGYFPVRVPLADAGEPRLAWTNHNGTTRPGLQLVVDIDGDGAGDGILVGESHYADGSPLYLDIHAATNWWLTGGSSQAFKDLAPSDDGGTGSSFNGTLAEWRSALPAGATVVRAGWSLGSGVEGDGVIDSITLGTTTYTFTGRNRAPEASSSFVEIPSGTSTTLRLGGTDPDGDPLVFTVNGSVVPDGAYPYAAKPGELGTEVITYTVTDAQGASRSGIVVVSVVPAAATMDVVVKPTIPTQARPVKIKAKIHSTGVSDGGEVVVRVDGRKAGTATVENGRVKVKVGRLERGLHDVKVKFKGTDSAKKTVETATVRVRR